MDNLESYFAEIDMKVLELKKMTENNGKEIERLSENFESKNENITLEILKCDDLHDVIEERIPPCKR
jgi:hypothetical protein